LLAYLENDAFFSSDDYQNAFTLPEGVTRK
jgi:hypothetical protein